MERIGLIALVLVSLILGGCSCSCGCGGEGSGRDGTIRIAIDPDWYPIDFGPQEPFVNGYTEDVLMEFARYSGVVFERTSANWDALLEGMVQGKYDAVLTSLPAYPFNLSKYDFTSNYLDLGPVLIVPVTSQTEDLAGLKGELVGLIAGDPAALILQKYPEVIMRNYPSIPDLLNALVNGEIEGALLNKVPAASYVADLYAGRLKIVSDPMTDAGLHLVALKGEQESLVRAFEKSINHFRKKKKLGELQKKWNLEPDAR